MSTSEEVKTDYGPLADLEEQQFKRLYHALDEPILDIRKKYFTFFTIAGILFLALLVLFAYWIKIPNYIKIPVRIENAVHEQVVVFNHSVRVAEFYASSGDTLKRGGPIVRIHSPEIQSLIAAIKTEEKKLHLLQKVDSVLVNEQIAQLEKENLMLYSKLETLKKDQHAATDLHQTNTEAMQAELSYLETVFERNKVLFQDSTISELRFLECQKDYLNKKAELASLKHAYSRTEHDITLQTQQINEELVRNENNQALLFSSYQADKNKISEQIASAKHQLDLYYGSHYMLDGTLILTAPKAGVLTYAYPSQQLLETGATLFRLQSGEGNFSATGTISADKIGYIQSGMPVKVRLETFPVYEWGSLSGAVETVSRSPDEKGGYFLKVLMKSNNLKITPLLQNGQIGVAAILFEEKSLAEYLSNRIQKTAFEVLD